jgi:hypothetical protein
MADDLVGELGGDIDAIEVRFDNAPELVGNSLIDEEDIDNAEIHEIPGAIISHEELENNIIPQKSDEFVCSKCFMIKHQSQQVNTSKDNPICRDCA